MSTLKTAPRSTSECIEKLAKLHRIRANDVRALGILQARRSEIVLHGSMHELEQHDIQRAKLQRHHDLTVLDIAVCHDEHGLAMVNDARRDGSQEGA